MKRFWQSSVFFLCVAASAAGAYNVMSDNDEVEKLAKETACGGKGAPCSAAKTSLSRSAIAQTFEFAMPKGKTTTVRCARAFLLVGEYACAVR
jgi:hypothetical protein